MDGKYAIHYMNPSCTCRLWGDLWIISVALDSFFATAERGVVLSSDNLLYSEYTRHLILNVTRPVQLPLKLSWSVTATQSFGLLGAS